MTSTNEQREDHGTLEILAQTPALRDDLIIRLQVYGSRTCYLIEDPLSSEFARVGLAEYAVIALLDGRTTIAEALAHTAAELGPEALTEDEAAELCQWLIHSQLASTTQSQSASRLVEARERTVQQDLGCRFNPIMQRIPLFNPDRLLQRALPWVGWLFSGPVMAAWLVVMLVAAAIVLVRWNELTANAEVIVARANWGWLFASWVALKFLHESGHAVACRRGGGPVREAGVMLVLLAPLPYVDVTSSWRFDSKWQRMLTAAAGVYVELLVAAVAVIVWATSNSPVVQLHARNLIVLATVVTLLFNLNPLMRFDGYYLLCDWCGLPNLATHGRQWLMYVVRRHLLGVDVRFPHLPPGRLWPVAVYAIAAFQWRLGVLVALIFAAEALFWGAGIVLAVAAAVWMVLPAVRLIGETLRRGTGTCWRASVAVGLSLVTLLVAGHVPWHSRVTAPFVVDYAELREVRSPVGGFVERVLVEEGDAVDAGELLAVLRNRELQLDAEKVQIELHEAQLRARRFRSAQQLVSWQVELGNIAALESKLQQLLERTARLEVRAPIGGTVTRAEVRQLLGAFVNLGDRLLTIGGAGPLRLQALVPQNDAAAFSGRQAAVRVHIWGGDHRWLAAHVLRLHPRAATSLPHAALGSSSGGPLPVREKADSRGTSDRWELLEPHVVAEAVLSGNSGSLAPGQIGLMAVRHDRGSLRSVVLEGVRDWFETWERSAAVPFSLPMPSGHE